MRFSLTCFTSKSQVLCAQLNHNSKSASCCVGQMHSSSPLQNPSKMPTLSLRIVDGPTNSESVNMKANNSALLIVLCSSNFANIVPGIAYHSFSSLSLSSCTTAQPPPASLPDTPSTNHQLQCVCESHLPFSSKTATISTADSKACCLTNLLQILDGIPVLLASSNLSSTTLHSSDMILHIVFLFLPSPLLAVV